MLQPKLIQKIGTELAIAWSDGQESYLPLEALRRACPCASCGGEPDFLGRVARPGELNPRREGVTEPGSLPSAPT